MNFAYVAVYSPTRVRLSQSYCHSDFHVRRLFLKLVACASGWPCSVSEILWKVRYEGYRGNGIAACACAFTSMKQHASSSRKGRLNLNLPLLSSSAGGTHCRVIGHVLSMEEKKTLSRWNLPVLLLPCVRCDISIYNVVNYITTNIMWVKACKRIKLIRDTCAPSLAFTRACTYGYLHLSAYRCSEIESRDATIWTWNESRQKAH